MGPDAQRRRRGHHPAAAILAIAGTAVVAGAAPSARAEVSLDAIDAQRVALVRAWAEGPREVQRYCASVAPELADALGRRLHAFEDRQHDRLARARRVLGEVRMREGASAPARVSVEAMLEIAPSSAGRPPSRDACERFVSEWPAREDDDAAQVDEALDALVRRGYSPR